MIVLDCEQGSEEWVRARLGIPTASELHHIVTPARLQRSKSADDYIDRCVAEWVTGQPDSEFMGTFWTDRGHQYEDSARALFELETGHAVRPVGFVYADESRTVGCSPDGLIEGVGGVELKCPKLSTHLGYMRRGGVPSRYWLQVQGCLWVTGLPRWWWMSYHPHPNVPPVIVEVEPCEKTFEALAEIVPAVLAEIQVVKDLLLAHGVEPDSYEAAHGEEWEPEEAAF